MSEYGGIYAVDGATGTAANAVTGLTSTAWTKVSGFTALAPNNGIAVSHPFDQMEVLHDGIYYAFCSLDFFGTTDDQLEFTILRDSQATNLKADFYVTRTGTYAEHIQFGGLIELDAGDIIALGVQLAAGSGEITVKHGQLGLYGVS